MNVSMLARLSRSVAQAQMTRGSGVSVRVRCKSRRLGHWEGKTVDKRIYIYMQTYSILLNLAAPFFAELSLCVMCVFLIELLDCIFGSCNDGSKYATIIAAVCSEVHFILMFTVMPLILLGNLQLSHQASINLGGPTSEFLLATT